MMEDASKQVLKSFALRCDAKIVCYPERYVDARGKAMWQTMCNILELGHVA
jgi:hypothetical protein